uniref:Uncharacterized protein n=1 Tax=Grammatophora oceanica TaxID=210454 RepID=A0A7S1VSC7_9STRA|mmetsp:Transcript_53283/g.79589  ORF Transcript_53283/g.79589 Transcript_53283/m.79589 type:complete len:1114 (+) Transcript_53283:97-3438(+)
MPPQTPDSNRPPVDLDEDIDILDPNKVSSRAKRRREEAVKRLVADVHKRPDQSTLVESHEFLVASTVATALERGLDKDLHAELVQEAKENAARIGQVCHDHSDAFLASVGRVVALGTPSSKLSEQIQIANDELQDSTAGQMLEAAALWEHAQQAHARARTLASMVKACRNVAVLLERAKKQASLGRPRAALDAVDEARTCLTAPVSSLLLGGGGPGGGAEGGDNEKSSSKHVLSLEETPFGSRAMTMLPKIENEVLMGARRGLNRWFLALRSGGDGAKAGRAVLRKCAHSIAMGPSNLGIGGHLPPAYLWRAKVADNLISRLDQNGKVNRAVRQGYWFDRDAPKEADRLEAATLPGMERRTEAFAAAFGWYRCWEENASLLVDVSKYDESLPPEGLSGSAHGRGLSGSRHGRRTLGFRARETNRGANPRHNLSVSKKDSATKKDQHSAWASLLVPSVLFEDSPTRKEDDTKLMSMPESVHPVRRAELAFSLLGRSDEFVQYYEQNRFGDMKIGGTSKDDKDGGETRSSLSSLTGDDVSVGTDRIFFAKSLPHLCSSVVGFSAVEAALELGNFEDEDEEAADKPKGGSSNHTSRFRDSSARYERSLVAELGTLLRGRATGASLAELARSSSLMASFRSSLKIVHPSSSTRRSDKELLAMDVDILMTALKVAQDEQLMATKRVVSDDRKEPMLVTTSDWAQARESGRKLTDAVPVEELVGIPFGLKELKQRSKRNSSGMEDPSFAQKYSNRSAKMQDEFYTFSRSVPEVVRSIHARTIACAAFALSQEELGQLFSQKKGSGAAGYVLDCMEACISVTAIGMQDSENALEEGSVEKAVQTMANIAALQHTLSRLFGAIMRGMCHVGMIRADQLEDTFAYAEQILRGADKSCDAQVGTMYNLVYEICRSKIDSHINFALDNFQWVSRAPRDMPNAYCEGLIQYLRTVFNSLGPMDEGSRFGLHFSCCGHVAERLVKLVTDPAGGDNYVGADDEGLPPITRIDAFGLKNLALDVTEFERFADSTGVPQLSECFNELKGLCSAMLDPALPHLLMPNNAAERRRKYPFVSMEKVGNILEKYVGMGLGDKLMGGSGRKYEILLMEKKEVQQLVRVVRSQEQ